MTIFDELTADHETQRALMLRVTNTSGDTRERAAAWSALRAALQDHAAAEERHFYAPLMQVDITMEMARHSVAEHKELDDFVERLDSTEMDSPGWLQIAKQLAERLEHHLAEEEREVFPLAGKALTGAQKQSLARDYRAMMEEARAA